MIGQLRCVVPYRRLVKKSVMNIWHGIYCCHLIFYREERGDHKKWENQGRCGNGQWSAAPTAFFPSEKSSISLTRLIGSPLITAHLPALDPRKRTLPSSRRLVRSLISTAGLSTSSSARKLGPSARDGAPRKNCSGRHWNGDLPGRSLPARARSLCRCPVWERPEAGSVSRGSGTAAAAGTYINKHRMTHMIGGVCPAGVL